MADIDFVIGAVDKSQPAFDSIDRTLDRVAADVQIVNERFSESVKRAVELAGALAIAATGYKAIVSTIGGIEGALDKFSTHVLAVSSFGKTMQIQGGVSRDAAMSMAKEFEELASQMQLTLGVADEMILSLMSQARAQGVGTDKLKEATEAAIGLAAVTGRSQSDAMRMVTDAINGEFSALENLVPAIKNASTAQEKLEQVNRLARAGIVAQADSLTGLQAAREREEEAISNLGVMVGEVLAPAFLASSNAMREFAEMLQARLGPALESVRDWVIYAVTAFQTLMSESGTIFELMVTTIELKFEQMRSVAEQAFTNILNYAAWFGNNFTNLISDGFSATLTILENWATKAGNAILVLWDFIAGGMQGGMDALMRDIGSAMSGNLLEGFTAKTDSLPEIMARQISSAESVLQGEADRLGGQIGKTFAERLQENMSIAEGKAVDKIKADIDLKLGDVDGKDKKDKGGANEAILQTIEGRLITRGPAEKREDYMRVIADNSTKQVDSLEDLKGHAQAVQSEIAKLREEMAGTPKIQIAGAPA